MLRDLSVQSFVMGVLTAFVGFSSAFAVVLHGLKGVGATDAEAASGLMALSVAMGLCGIVLSIRTRMPISIAWSTPGAAFLATAGPAEGGFPVAVGAFLATGLLIVAAGLFKPLSRAVSAIPAPLANAMLAGVLIGLCFAPVRAVAVSPWFGLPLVLAYFIGGAVNRLAAIPCALLAFAGVIVFGVEMPEGAMANVWHAVLPAPVAVARADATSAAPPVSQVDGAPLRANLTARTASTPMRPNQVIVSARLRGRTRARPTGPAVCSSNDNHPRSASAPSRATGARTIDQRARAGPESAPKMSTRWTPT